MFSRLEDSAVNLADSIQHGGLPGATGSVAPSILEVNSNFLLLLFRFLFINYPYLFLPIEWKSSDSEGYAST